MVLVVGAGCSQRSAAKGGYRLDTEAGSPSRSKTPSPLVRGQLSSGVYYSTRFLPAVKLTVPSGWRLDSESATQVAFVHVGDPAHATVIVTQVGSLQVSDDPYDRGVSVFNRQYHRSGRTQSAEIRRRPEVVVEPVGPVDVGGVSAPTVVARSTVVGSQTDPCTPTVPCPFVPLADPAYGWLLSPQEAVLLVEPRRSGLAVMIGGNADVLTLRTIATPLLASLRVTTE
jgi:hypothetical protein